MNTYNAILIHPSTNGGRISGIINLKNNGIYFESNSFNYYISFTNLSITAGGASNRFIFFRDTTQHEISIYTSEKNILNDPFLKSNDKFKGQIKKSKSDLKKTLKGTIYILGLFTGLLGGLYLLKDKMVDNLATQIPMSWEQKAGDKLFTTMSLQYEFIQNDTLKKEFIKVAKPLLQQIEKEGYKIDLYFVKDPSINAFALPGGKVVIQTGLLQNANSWEEVMGVLSHELAHVTKRHHIRGIINNLGVFTILSATFGDVSAIAGTFLSMGGELASLSNSRDFENEADEVGRMYLIKSKINPDGLIRFFEMIEKEEKTILDSTITKKVDLSFLSTHPDVKERIKKLKDIQKKDSTKYPTIPHSFENFKNKIVNLK